MEKNDPIEWGLRRDITPRVGARLVQERNQLHYLADRAGVTGIFNEAESRKLNAAFPHFVEQMELMLLSGELNPRYAHCVTLYHDGFTCEADTLGSYGYVYIVIYPTQR
ncbi:type IV toxin-antitoxin system YeeU family antitoxin [Morganella sp. B601]|uniref:type IV toxin-antitoxin system YeeU family antitoxin n=1 Tax=Morganella TaxID=581 RepID=UPI00040CA098|nr:type IV toxin-antitoxin system YeeU family antitoxin [Morganella morganii]ECH9836808.1 type IV toxin-antitoxin system YeeU family antitoxin [Salmonella enterica subsp. enterica serovar Enteritidis]EKW3935666.1 type IV toxin-antitoxin system YeeU family antitoxin [Morganella morganii]EKW3938383.1 type IV toxin-antitoxin system YeeU family antitoxin [Morganella morganii]HBN5913045.1 type IV toxin-antitoxin system YeeU family antitoxin [Morganella morganii]HCR3333055.1 type IV toxin-antitoxin 